MSTQAPVRILCSLAEHGYTATVEGGELKIQGPQPLTGSLPMSIKAWRDELITYLNNYCGGAWPPRGPWAYGDGTPQDPPIPWEEFRYAEYLLRLADLLEEYYRSFPIAAGYPDDPDAREGGRRCARALEETALEFVAYASRQRSTWPNRPGE